MAETAQIELSNRLGGRRLTTIIATDICGYSAASERNDADAIGLVDSVFGYFETAVIRHKGRVFKRIADGFLAEFPSAESAMRAALDYVALVGKHAPPLAQVRTGIHVGDVTERPDGDLLGHGVNVAVRLQEEARIGGILASVNVVNLLRQSAPFFDIRRKRSLSLKNMSEPVLVYDIIATDEPTGRSPFRLPGKKTLSATAFLCVCVLGALAYFNYSETLSKNRLSRALEAYTPGAGQASTPMPSISQDYIRNVLRKLQASKIPSHQASFALLESGHIDQAIDKLEASLSGMSASSEDYVNTLHQIAALSYYHDSAKSVATYESLLQINPQDSSAMIPLVKAYQVRLEVDKAYELYEDIIEQQIGTPEEKLRLQIDMSFNLILQQEFESAVGILERMKTEIPTAENRELFLEWQFLLGYAYIRIGRLDEGGDLLTLTVAELKDIPANETLPRAYSALGILSQIRADQDSGLRELHLKQALAYYEDQYEAAQRIDKKRELPEALYSMGEVRLDLGDLEGARSDFLNAFRLARSSHYITSERRARIGLARLDKLEGDQDAACRQIQKVEKLYAKNTDVKPSAKNLETLRDIGCDWP